MAVTIRDAEPKDIQSIVKWTDGHLQFYDCFHYPSTRIICAENGTPVMYGIIYGGAIAEGFGMKPGITAREWVEGVTALFDRYEEMCKQAGITDIICFIGTGAEHLEKMALKRGFVREEKLHVYRFKVEVADVRQPQSGERGANSDTAADGLVQSTGPES